MRRQAVTAARLNGNCWSVNSTRQYQAAVLCTGHTLWMAAACRTASCHPIPASPVAVTTRYSL